jgi:hypothetical protein
LLSWLFSPCFFEKTVKLGFLDAELFPYFMSSDPLRFDIAVDRHDVHAERGREFLCGVELFVFFGHGIVIIILYIGLHSKLAFYAYSVAFTDRLRCSEGCHSAYSFLDAECEMARILRSRSSLDHTSRGA